MKMLSIIIILFCLAMVTDAQPGKYAGIKKSLINTVYADSRKIKGLSGWSFVEGSVLTPVNDREMILVDVFKKGTSFLVFFSFEKDSGSQKYTILDVLEIKPVTKGWSVETSFCKQNETDDPWIVAWTKITSTEYMKIHKKAWRFNRDKRQIEVISVKGVACLNEGFDLTLNDYEINDQFTGK